MKGRVRVRSAPTERSASAAPSVAGYALAVLVSLVVLALEIAAADALEQGTTSDVVDVFVVVLLFGAVPAAVLGSVGALAVHLLTRNNAAQWPAVLLAGAAGLVAGWVVYRGDHDVAVVLVGLGAAVGRLAVVPLVRRRRRGAPEPVLSSDG